MPAGNHRQRIGRNGRNVLEKSVDQKGRGLPQPPDVFGVGFPGKCNQVGNVKFGPALEQDIDRGGVRGTTIKDMRTLDVPEVLPQPFEGTTRCCRGSLAGALRVEECCRWEHQKPQSAYPLVPEGRGAEAPLGLSLASPEGRGAEATLGLSLASSRRISMLPLK